MKKVYVFCCLLILTGLLSNVNAQLLQWNTFGNLGTETTEPSVFNNANIAASNLTMGAGVTPAANTNRFGGSNWWNTGNSANSTLAEAIAGNDYLEFIVTPNGGYSFTPTSFVFTWDRSGTGPSNVTLRSSADGFTTDLGTTTGIVGGAFASNTITITGLTNLTTATTFRLYGYNGTATGGTGGFDINVNAVNVQLNGTTAPSGSPLINVTPSSLTGFLALLGVPSAEQNYVVDGSNLTNDIIITPPANFEISTGTGGGFIPTNPITLTQTGGTVPATNIYVRMNAGALGPVGGNITNTSTGATTKNVAVSGNSLANEPASQGVISFGTITNSTIEVNFSAGAGPNQILVVRALVAVANHPVDGTTYTPNTVFGTGSNLGGNTYAVYTGVSGGIVTVTGLTVGTQYHFALYEYDDEFTAGAENYLITPLSTGNATTLSTAFSYVWIGGNNGSWTTATNWAPTRLFPATNDSLLFTGGVLDTVINVPTQSIGYLGVSLNTQVNLQAGASGNTLTIGNLPGTDLFVEAGSQLNIGSANNLTINLITGATGTINGYMRFTAGAHKLTAADASAVTFTSGSTFRAGTGFSSNPFGTTGTANSIIFNSGSVMEQVAGSNPFALAQPASLVTFQAGSLYKVVGSSFSPSFSGRTYANVEFAGSGTSSMTGTNAMSIDNLTITSGTVNINMTATPGHSIKGNISIAPGATLNFNPASTSTLNLNGTGLQTLTNSGTLSFGLHQALTFNNAGGFTFNSDVRLDSLVTFTAGIVKMTSPAILIIDTAGRVTGASNSSYVDGKVKKIGNIDFIFPVGKTGFGYVPIELSTYVGGTNADEFTAEYRRGNARLLGPVTAGAGLSHVSGCDYWTLDKGIATPVSVDVTGYWSANNVCNGTYIDNLGSLTLAHFDGAGWDSYAISPILGGGSTTGAGSIRWPGATAFSPFSLASTTFGQNPLPISINYFNGFKQNSSHLLNWKVTCNSTPYVHIEMERSADGRNFSGIYSIQATALRCQQPFSYTDAAPVSGINYYRLKMTDADGKVTYSSVVHLINATKGIDILSIAPNPIVGGKFNLRVSAAQNAKMEIVISDMQGRLLQKQSVNLVAGYNAVPVQVSNLASGNYQVYGITDEGRSKVLRFVVQ